MKLNKNIENKSQVGSSLANAVYLGLSECAQHLSLSNIKNSLIRARVTRRLFATIRQSTFQRATKVVAGKYNF